METWKSVMDFDSYEVSDAGRVRICKTGRILKTHARRRGKHDTPYLRVGLVRDGKQFHRLIHTLVLQAFVGPRPHAQQCRHLNGNSLDNRLENLTWGTFHENFADRVAHNRDYYLSPADIATILVARQHMEQFLATKVGCTIGTVRRVWAEDVRKRNARDL